MVGHVRGRWYSSREPSNSLRNQNSVLLNAQRIASHGRVLNRVTFWQGAPHLGVELSVANSRPAALDALRPLGPAPAGPTPSPLVPMPAFCFCPSVGVRLPAGGSGKPGKKPECGSTVYKEAQSEQGLRIKHNLGLARHRLPQSWH